MKHNGRKVNLNVLTLRFVAGFVSDVPAVSPVCQVVNAQSQSHDAIGVDKPLRAWRYFAYIVFPIIYCADNGRSGSAAT
jgi:hypothetical protein